ncbi:hypothetical protein SAICODRAFT_21896 [Saitoella complicata NRRL Y-17804]|uniref:uncharacterized protein n=1 Tax=Saitoella complicata (strain BCRC 22490 / CBS 7301 / JCM 7358 / NBRC 10748 / NRRL Y-17804) TaxID=698492 RepID=UPI00086694DC|nr:uncharacterized protein SAICODRAFT_21896 [Saitoella complicata NRRL Y-17804]ODQ50150.1 hypothetical protein SAICODRAFT_21896 [Saitoella complicata NRRL Y-17804]
MRFSILTTAIAVGASALFSIASASDAHIAKFDALAAKHKGLIDLDDQLYNEITSGPRSYSVAVLLTATAPQFSCNMCREIDPEYALVASSLQKANKGKKFFDPSEKVYLTRLDFLNGKSIFQRLQLTTAPNIYIFHPTTGDLAKTNPDEPTVHDMLHAGPTADAIVRFLSSTLKRSPITLVRPLNYAKIVTTVFALLATLTALKLSYRYLIPIIQSKRLWTGITLFLVLLFVSGHMFNQIRKTPYVVPDGNGGVSYIAGGFQNQFGMETQIVMVVYGVLAFSTVALAIQAPRMLAPQRQSVAIWVWTGVILLMFSFLMHVFKIKNGGYPFKLLL